MIADGKHPTTEKRISQAAKAADRRTTFKVIANAWVVTEARRKQWSDDYIEEVNQSLRNHLCDLDALPISSVVARSFAWPSPITTRRESEVNCERPRHQPHHADDRVDKYRRASLPRRLT
ncbi:MAG TPA: hypothetical protein VNG69_07265, partial [Casimicrobiaceae bacterium]|nr:hypothetical protein [Casimicrobiaceae bacterium]